MSGRVFCGWLRRAADFIARLLVRYDVWRFGFVDHQAKIGLRGEQYAARMLRRQGFRVVAHSEADFGGEIDLIAVDRRRPREIVFVEVKTLATRKPGHPAERVDDDKQARITRAAARYLMRNRLLEARCRFDVIAIWWPPDAGEPYKVEHYRSAFEATGLDSFFT